MELRAVHIVHLGGENEPPENIEIRRDYVPSGLGIGSVVGTFSTEDPNTGGSYTYSLVPGTGSEDNESFFIDGDKLRTNEIFNNEIKDTYFIRVRSTDQGGLWIEKSFTIKISPPLKTGGIYLPLMLNSNTYPLRNGGFEEGPNVGWQEYSSNGFDLIYYWPAMAHKGNWLAWLGGNDDEISSISQWVAIQPAKPYLHYWYWIDSYDICGFDEFLVMINGDVVKRYDLCWEEDTWGWMPGMVDLSPYIGQLVKIKFEVETDSSNYSNLFIDDIELTSKSTLSAPEFRDGEINLTEIDKIEFKKEKPLPGEQP